MDEATLETRGAEPLKPYLTAIDAMKTKADLVKLLSSSIAYAAPFGLGIEADVADPKRYAVWAAQGGLGMPERDYYLGKSGKIRRLPRRL